MASKKLDTFANVAAIQVTETAANTQTSAKFAFPFSIMDKMALIVSRVEFDFVNLMTALTASGDRMTLALTAAATVVNIMNPADPLIIDSAKISRYDLGVAASGFFLRQPFVKDYSNLPGGGLLLAPSPLYAMVEGASAAVACQASFRIYYTYIELSTDEYWQLVESRRIISS